MTARITERLNARLGRWLPERRIFVRTDLDTRYVRLRPLTQALALGGAGLVALWTVVASAVLVMDMIGSGNLRALSARETQLHEARLTALAAERDRLADEAALAQERFALALGRISAMQAELLEAENRRRELETGIEVIQTTLRRAIQERDSARAEREALALALAGPQGISTEPGRMREAAETLDLLAAALAHAAAERDAYAAAAMEARSEVEEIALEKRLLEQRTDMILARLEEAVNISMTPLERILRNAGLSPDSILEAIRRGRAAQEAALTPIAWSSRGSVSEQELRAQGILEGLERVNHYRLALDRLPIANPVRAAVRFTSGFGMRRDPKTGARRMHTGTDFAGPTGTAIYATGDGVVREAGWHSGYGKMVVIEHDFGISTLYAHLSRIRVTEGQRVSRGDRIGDMGNTGRSTGTHLHYEVHVNGRPVNPMTYIRAANDVR